MRECTDQKNSEYGRVLRSGGSSLYLEITEDWFKAYSEKNIFRENYGSKINPAKGYVAGKL